MFLVIFQQIQRLIMGMENTKIPLTFYFFSFLAVVILRYIGEGYSQPFNYLNIPYSFAYFWSFIHTAIGYSALGLGFIAIFRIAARIPLREAARIVMAGYIIIWMTPFLDLILGPLTGWPTANIYIHPNQHVNILFAYLTAYGGFSGMSLGLRLEIMTLIVSLCIYFSMKGLRFFSTLTLTWLSYSWLFFMSCSPYVVSIVMNSLGIHYQYNNTVMINYYVLSSLVLCGTLWFMENDVHQLQRLFDKQQAINLTFSIFVGFLLAIILHRESLTRALMINIAFHELLLMLALTFVTMQAEFKNTTLIFYLLALTIAALTNTRVMFLFLLFIMVHVQYQLVSKQIHANKYTVIFYKYMNTLLLIILGMADVLYYL